MAAKSQKLLKQTVAVNEALILGSLHQHELTETAESLNTQLRTEIGERKQAEDTLRRARDYAESIVASVRMPLVVLDAALRVRTASRVFYEHFRVAAAETEGQLIYDIGNRQWDIPALRALLEEVLPEKNQIEDYEVRHTFEQLGPRVMLLNACRLPQAPGDEPLIIVSIEDTTERERAQNDLRASEGRFRALANAMPQLSWTAHADGFIHWYNQRWYEYTGTAVEEMEGWGWQSVHDPEQLPKVMERWKASIATGAPFEMVFPLRGADGQFRPFLTRVQPQRDAQGRVIQWIGTNTDVEELKRAEDELRASEERFRVLFDSGPVAIFSCDCHAVLQAYNRRAADLWGREPLCGAGGARHCGSLRLYHKDGRPLPHEESPIIEVLKTGVIIKDAEVVIERPDGTRVAVAVTFAPLKNEKGEITGAITAFYDITERLLLEDSLIARAKDLARADRSKDEFLAMLAHELRNPLAPLRSASEILKTAGVSDDERGEAHRILGRSIENMSRMIDDLLDVSRITEGKIELRKKPVALESILTAASSLARSGCAEHRQELTVTLPAEPVWLQGDATRLEQVFNNLLGNASKYSGDGSHIAVHAERSPGVEPPEVVITVKDDGTGIDLALLPSVFDLFMQATRASDRAQGGLGIGLTLVQRLVRLHGGSITAHSEGLDQGAQFIVRLPILREAPPPLPLPPPVPSEVPRRILIVDDNTDAARSLGILQQRRGHETRTAFTGPDAVTAAAEFLPEVVLLDIGLPGMDGFEVARHLRAMPALKGVFLIAMSGYGRDEDRAEAKQAGFDEYLVKPVDLDVLREAVRSGGRTDGLKK